MAVALVPVATTCDRPEIDRQLNELIVTLVEKAGMPVREATARAARRAATIATAKGWRADLVDYVAIRTVDLGAQYAARHPAAA